VNDRFGCFFASPLVDLREALLASIEIQLQRISDHKPPSGYRRNSAQERNNIENAV
jgi:hypothetical protein